MTSWRKAVLLGILVWLVPFLVALSITGVRDSWRALFESIMPVTVAVVVVAAALIHLRGVKTRPVREGFVIGLLWFAISVLIDLPLMLGPPLNMNITDYAADVGLTYVMMPIITTGMGAAVAIAGRADR